MSFSSIFYSSLTDESFVDKTRVWHKYKISILVSMMSLFALKLIKRANKHRETSAEQYVT